MKKHDIHQLIKILLVTCFVGSLQAEKQVNYSEYNVNHVTWGKPLKGIERPTFAPADLKGKVVIVEEFGILLPDCAARLKDLSRLAKKLDREKIPFAIILLHRQSQVSDEAIVKELRRLHEPIIVRTNGYTPVHWEGMPNTAFFGQDGVMRWKGDPRKSSYAKELKKFLKEAKK